MGSGELHDTRAVLCKVVDRKSGQEGTEAEKKVDKRRRTKGMEGRW